VFLPAPLTGVPADPRRLEFCCGAFFGLGGVILAGMALFFFSALSFFLDAFGEELCDQFWILFQ
jgi:hypothetical protein